MEFKGTEGEWKDQYGISGILILDLDNNLVAKVYNEEDAKLIIAAQDLLEALQELVADVDGNTLDDAQFNAMEKAKTAINKSLNQ